MKFKYRLYFFVIGFTIAGSLASCNIKPEKQDGAKDNPVEALSAGEMADISGEEVQGILQSYLEIKNTLVDAEQEKSQEAAKELMKKLAEHKDAGILKEMYSDAEKISTSSNLDGSREYFYDLSQSAYHFATLKETGMTLYKQYCPMAFNNRGAFWLSDREEVKNPYFGDKMLHCGSVQEKL